MEFKKTIADIVKITGMKPGTIRVYTKQLIEEGLARKNGVFTLYKEDAGIWLMNRKKMKKKICLKTNRRNASPGWLTNYDVCEKLGIPQHRLYKLTSQLMQAGLVRKKGVANEYKPEIVSFLQGGDSHM